MHSENPQIRTSTFKNQQPKIWGFEEMKIVSQRVFFVCVFLPEPIENGCLDKFLLISTYSVHSMFIYLLYLVKNQAKLARKIVGSYSRVFTVLLITFFICCFIMA